MTPLKVLESFISGTPLAASVLGTSNLKGNGIHLMGLVVWLRHNLEASGRCNEIESMGLENGETPNSVSAPLCLHGPPPVTEQKLKQQGDVTPHLSHIYIYIYVCVYMVQRCQPPPPLPPNGHGSAKYPPPCGCGPVVGLWWFRVGLELV